MASASEKTRIDFHSNVADKLNYTCRLIRKARAANCKIVVFHPDRQVLQSIDTALWTLEDTAFLPHVMADDVLASVTPVILSNGELEQSPHFELLVNLSTYSPENFELFARMIEIISSDHEETKLGRERYRQYHQQAFPLSHNVAK
ncbi:DNA polymerase III subunit chi [Undibacterium jejuense]|uniref:DNA polymerase III subunit chi n=2 Tax=Oxalobacteraceae TaxID=75682 RepID=A0A923KL46_9BURK|nr:DNA polymerase III subunit chi [Undibacterium jejuense]